MNANEEFIAKVKEFEDTIAELTKPIEDCQFALEVNANFSDVLSNLTEQVKGFREQLENAEASEDKKFKRVEKGKTYYTVSFGIFVKTFIVIEVCEKNDETDNAFFNSNNYFLTRERAQEVAAKLNHLMRMERLHDELCPDYSPNWQDGTEAKFFFSYCAKDNRYYYENSWALYNMGGTYFPSEIVQKACDILNAELEQTK